jgi:hypothetical protein
MKKMFYSLLVGGLFFTTGTVQAQFRSIPGAVTDSFKIRYPEAKTVTWRDQLSYFEAKFTLDNEKFTAKYSSKGEWQSSQKAIPQDKLPAGVKDGLSKSKYASEWTIYSVTVRYLPGHITQYILRVGKGDLSRKNLLFSSEGQLLKDGTTI